MIVLAVETTFGEGSLALASSGAGQSDWCDAATLPEEWKSATLHVELATLLARRGLKSGDLDGYAVATGPGTFTGLRIGLTAVKGLAEVHQKPVVGVSTLELVAAAACEVLPASFAGTLAPLLDARRGQVFAALYRAERNSLQSLMPDCVGSLGAFLEKAKATDCTEVRFCGPEVGQFSAEIASAGWDGSSLISVSLALAPTLARLGMERLQLGQGTPAVAADANYVRLSDAELFWKG